MITLIVNIEVNSDKIQEFIEATKKAQTETLKEEGCFHYEILQDSNVQNKFILIEKYEDEYALYQHKETLYFQEWRNTVNPITAPRISSKNVTL